MADALASGASVRKGVGVQIPPRAQEQLEIPGRQVLAGDFPRLRPESAPEYLQGSVSLIRMTAKDGSSRLQLWQLRGICVAARARGHPCCCRLVVVMKENPLDISWTRAVGSALGAVSSAVLLSTLGVAGTLIGAALGSLVITIGGAVYSSSLELTQDKVLKATARSDQPGARARAQGDPEVSAATISAPESTPAPLNAPDGSTPHKPWGQVMRNLPWKRIAGVSAALFAMAMAIILAFELTTGRAVSSFTGGSTAETGTSIPGFSGTDSSETDTEQDSEDELPADEQQDEAPVDEQEDPAPLEEQPQDQAPQDQAPQDQAP